MNDLQDATRSDVLAVDGAFFSALLRRDVDRLAELLEPGFVIVDVGSGSVAGKEQFLAAVGSGVVVFSEIRAFHEEALIRVYGEVAFVVCQTEMKFALPDGSSYAGASRYTHAFVRGDGAWQLVSAQGTPIQSR